MSEQPHGIAIVGLGTVGLRYVEQYQSHPGFRIVGGYDTSAEACALAADRFGIDIAGSADTLIANPAVDMVYIAVPPQHHRRLAEAAVAADKAVLCEKPLAVTDADGVAMVDRVAASTAGSAINFVFGAAPSAQALIADIEAARAMAEQGRDPVRGVELRVHFEHWPRAWQAGATWLRDRDQGGWVREVVSHYIFLILRLFGPPTIERSTIVYPDDGTSEQRLTAALGCGAIPVSITGSSDAAGPDEVEFTVRGTHRSWRLTNWYEYCVADLDGEWRPALSVEAASGPAAYAAQLDGVHRMIGGESHSLATFAEALTVQRLVEALVRGESAGSD